VLESLFGIKDRTVRDLADKGIIKRDSHGKYLFWSSVRSYITTLKVNNLGKNEKLDDDESELDLSQEKALHEHIKRQITDIKLQLIKGQVHKAEDVESVMNDIFTRFKSKLTALPTKLAKRLEMKNRVEIQEILKNEINNALVELSAYNPADFYSDEHIELSGDALNLVEVEDNEET